MDIVDRLREMYVQHGTNYVQQAADEIERLRADLYELQTERDIMRTNNDVLSAERDALERKYKRLKSLVTEYLPCDLTVAKNAIDAAIAKHNKRVLDLERGE